MSDSLNKLFENLDGQLDVHEPEIGHFNRFEARLNGKSKQRKRPLVLYSAISVAASIVLLIGVWLGSSYSNEGMELAGISTEMAETQSYFIATIHTEIEKIENSRNADTEQMISDAFTQIEKLEEQYTLLTLELRESTEDKRIIYAMITNFQQRITILQDLLNQIENVQHQKQLKNDTYA